MGCEVRLISPQYVSPFVKTNKNDRNDAQAIVEAASRPTMNFVVVKSVEQQDMQAVHRVRQLLVQQRTALEIMQQIQAIEGHIQAQRDARRCTLSRTHQGLAPRPKAGEPGGW